MMSHMRPTLLPLSTCDDWLRDHPSWSCVAAGHSSPDSGFASYPLVSLIRSFGFANYREVLAFVQKVGHSAESLDHHPDMLVRYDTVEVRTSTHDARGITELDLRLAEAIDREFASHQAGGHGA
jgi:4a-hydroxytetrahydrobiopterin dehydratase